MGAALLFMIFGLLFFVLIVRFITIQYTGEVKGTALAAQAQKMYMRSDVLQAKRGTIYDVKGEVIAEDTASYTLVAILDESVTADPDRPNHVVDPRTTATKLAQHLPLSEQEIYDLLSKKGRFQVEFGQAGRDLSHQVKTAIENMKLPGITFVKDTKRFYPNGVFASHLIGYAQREQGNDEQSITIGQSGLEKSHNDLLQGEDGFIKYSGDIWNYILPNSEKQVKEPKNGQDIYLTIDKKIQTFLEDAMNKVDEQFSPERMLAVVADPKTGAILAMGQRPTYHPVTREGIDKSWNNEVVESTIEPGSTMKVFSLAAAVEEKKFNPNEFYESGQYYVSKNSRPINDHNRGRGWGTISFLEGVQRSSNVAFATLLEKMGTDTWRKYMDAFKFGKKTEIGLPNEANGKILYNEPIEKVTSVYGQGTTVTPLQMVQAMTAIGNDGKMMKPYVVEKIVDANGEKVKQTKPKVVGEPISSETAKEVREILETVITAPKGTGHLYHIDGYEVAGKTGTSQLSSPTGGYLTGRNNYLFSFIGLAPVDDPQLIVYVAVEKPQLGQADVGGVPVSMIFNPVMKNSLQYLNIEPEKNDESKIIQLADLSDMTVKEAEKYLKDNRLVPIKLGKGTKVVGQTPRKAMSLIEGEKVVIKTDGELTIPNMIGWSKRDVLKVATLSGLKVNMVGDGYVVKQNVKPNSPVNEGDLLVVNFATPKELLEIDKTSEENDGDVPLD